MPINIFLKECRAVSYITTWAIYQHQEMWKYHCSWKSTNKKNTPENSTSTFLYHFWKLHSLFNHSYSWIQQIMPALPFLQEISYPQPTHGFFSYNHQKQYVFLYYTIHFFKYYKKLRYIPNMTHKSSNYSELGIILILLLLGPVTWLASYLYSRVLN